MTDTPATDAPTGATGDDPKPGTPVGGSVDMDAMVARVAAKTDEPPEVVAVIVNHFMDDFVATLLGGGKLRLSDHGTFRGALSSVGDLRIKHRAWTPPAPDETSEDEPGPESVTGVQSAD